MITYVSILKSVKHMNYYNVKVYLGTVTFCLSSFLITVLNASIYFSSCSLNLQEKLFLAKKEGKNTFI